MGSFCNYYHLSDGFTHFPQEAVPKREPLPVYVSLEGGPIAGVFCRADSRGCGLKKKGQTENSFCNRLRHDFFTAHFKKFSSNRSFSANWGKATPLFQPQIEET